MPGVLATLKRVLTQRCSSYDNNSVPLVEYKDKRIQTP